MSTPTLPPGAERLARTVAAVAPLDEAALAAARRRQDDLTKPPGSLGRLEVLAAQLAGIQGRERPMAARRASRRHW